MLVELSLDFSRIAPESHLAGSFENFIAAGYILARS